MIYPISSFQADTVDSTSSWAWRYWDEHRADARLSPTLFMADSQTQGRGAGRGRVWHSAPGSGLFMSLLLPAVPTAWIATQTLPKLAGLGCHRVLRNCWPDLPVVLKGINDLYLQLPARTEDLSESRLGKLGGILVEARWRPGSDIHAVVIGIGLNLRSSGVTSATAYPVATLADAIDPQQLANLERQVLAHDLARAITDALTTLTPDTALTQWLACKGMNSR